jgi:hypothetical protein
MFSILNAEPVTRFYSTLNLPHILRTTFAGGKSMNQLFEAHLVEVLGILLKEIRRRQIRATTKPPGPGCSLHICKATRG